jgi:hypothetical protein
MANTALHIQKAGVESYPRVIELSRSAVKTGCFGLSQSAYHSSPADLPPRLSDEGLLKKVVELFY